jgi:hypothetical protein
LEKNSEQYPSVFPETPESSLLAIELVNVAKAELERLHDRQRMVVTLRNMLGFDSGETVGRIHADDIEPAFCDHVLETFRRLGQRDAPSQ